MTEGNDVFFLYLWDMILSLAAAVPENADFGGFDWLAIAFQIVVFLGVAWVVAFGLGFAVRRGWDGGARE